MSSRTDASPIVFVVEEDSSMRHSLVALIAGAGLEACAFVTLDDFLASAHVHAPSCAVLGVSIQELRTIDVQTRFGQRTGELPLIFITGEVDLPMTVRVMKGGAVDVLSKPVDGEALLRDIAEAVALSRAALEAYEHLAALRREYATLSKREREVLPLLIAGLLNKQVGAELGISETTVKVHRGRVMRKMGARSFAELVGKAADLGLSPHYRNSLTHNMPLLARLPLAPWQC
jgi:FixJ family two-component response regulator